MTNSSHVLKKCLSYQEASATINQLHSIFKSKFQRNLIPDLTTSFLCSPRLHSINQNGQLVSKRQQNDFGGAMGYKPVAQETYDVTIRWDNGDSKAEKDVQWIKGVDISQLK